MMIYDNFFTLQDLFGLLQSGRNSLQKGHLHILHVVSRHVLFGVVLAHCANIIEKRVIHLPPAQNDSLHPLEPL